MKAKVEEMQAKVVEAEAEVPRAMADAFQSGRLDILDYYQMRNVQADTDMRTSIATAGIARSGTDRITASAPMAARPGKTKDLGET